MAGLGSGSDEDASTVEKCTRPRQRTLSRAMSKQSGQARTDSEDADENAFYLENNVRSKPRILSWTVSRQSGRDGTDSELADEDPFYLEKYLRGDQKNSSCAPSSHRKLGRTDSSIAEEDPFYLEKYLKPSRPIMDRKIETRALPNSFSSNLMRKTSESVNSSLASSRVPSIDGASKVRTIVNWLEKSSSSPAAFQETFPTPTVTTHSRTDSADSSTSRYSDESTQQDQKQTPVQSGTTNHDNRYAVFNNSPGASEEYELNVLNYRQFFNNRPLMRCLDDNQPEGKFFKRSSLSNTARTEVTCKTPTKMNQELDKDPKAVEKPDNLETSAEEQSVEPVEHIRDPEEAKAFWANVRAQLRFTVDDSEGEGEHQNASAVSHEDNGDGDKTPCQHTRRDSHWVMMQVPSHHSYSCSMGEGNIYAGEHCPRIRLPPSPQSLASKSTGKKIAAFDEFLYNDAKWKQSQRRFASGPDLCADSYVDSLPLKKSLEDIDEFLGESTESVEGDECSQEEAETKSRNFVNMSKQDD